MNHQPIRSQLRWRCHRGMLELDLILLPFFDQHYDQLSSLEQKAFYRLLDFSDPELYAWLLTEQRPEDKGISALVELIHSKI